MWRHIGVAMTSDQHVVLVGLGSGMGTEPRTPGRSVSRLVLQKSYQRIVRQDELVWGIKDARSHLAQGR